MIHEIYPDGTIEWFCHNDECEFHQEPLFAHVDQPSVRYQFSSSGEQCGAVIVLPKCICGSQMSLKADYTLKDLRKGKVIVDLPEEYGGAKVMKLQHAHNLLIHHMLYLLDKAPCPPVISLPSRSVLESLLKAGASIGMACSVWFTHQVVADQVVQIPGYDMALLQTETKKEEIG